MISRNRLALRFTLISITCIILEAVIWDETTGNKRLFLTFVLVLFSYLAAFLFAGSIYNKLQKMVILIRRISQKNYSHKLSITEQKDLTLNDLEKVQNRLKKYSNRLSRNKEGFNIIIETLEEAIWIQNEKGFITDGNSAFKKLIGNKQIKGQYFWNIIREKELYNLSDKAWQLKENITTELQIENNYYICSATYSPLLEETIFILYDITEIRQLELLKKDLVLNVSHELRTPLTSIKGYLETMSDELSEEHQPYLKIILRNTDRLINIVQDLLTLSKLEHVQQIETEKTRTEEYLKNISSLFCHSLKSKKLDLEIKIDDNLPDFFADRFKFEQVLINLIDNAIIYTEIGSIKVSAKLVEEFEEEFAEFRIKDTGSGIPPESLPRLFERFYVVDKSRNRKMGGTGLGLSIVKHIVNLHQGKIEVKSVLGSGTEFIILLPMGK